MAITTPWDSMRRCGAGAESALLAAPYMKADALKLVLGMLAPNAAVECVTRWTPLDIRLGASDVECRQIVIEHGGSFRLHNGLHAKYYRFGEHALVGSANLTASGLGYGGGGNFEILCAPDAAFDGGAFERELTASSRQVSDAEYETWRTIAVDPMPMLNADADAAAPDAESGGRTGYAGLKGWIPQTRTPEYLWHIYAGELGELPETDTPSDEQVALAQHDLRMLQAPAGLPLDAFTAWMAAALAASPFIDAVRQTAGLAEQDAWDALADGWQVSLAAANRSLETANRWLLWFEG